MDFDANKPIYLQIVDNIKDRIINGDFSPGEKLPSVRDFAAQMAVNPNTMQRALAQLESEGLIYTERTSGRFVSLDAKTIKTTKDEQARNITKKYVQEMQALHYSLAEINTLVSESYTKASKEEQQ